MDIKNYSSKVMEKHRATIYPKFLECAEYTFDPFWQTLFHELAAGRCPRGCKLVRNQLYFHSSPRGVTSVELPQDPRELFLFTIDFFRERFRLVSKRDKKRVELDMDKARQELEDTYRLPWGQIKKKNVRTELFTEFLIQLGHKYQMSNNQLTQLENELQLAFERHVLLSSDVDYRNGRIYKIKGL